MRITGQISVLRTINRLLPRDGGMIDIVRGNLGQSFGLVELSGAGISRKEAVMQHK